MAPSTSTSKAPSSIQALANAIQTVFGTPSNTTEKNVIEQLEERKNKQKPKRSRSNSQTTTTTRPKKTKKW